MSNSSASAQFVAFADGEGSCRQANTSIRGIGTPLQADGLVAGIKFRRAVIHCPLLFQFSSDALKTGVAAWDTVTTNSNIGTRSIFPPRFEHCP